MKIRCGYVAIVGRPNVGKSTLLNALLGKKISITSRKPQTTRHRILGIKTTTSTQFVFVDTPGLHQESRRLLNRYLNRSALSTLGDVDVILWVIDAHRWSEEDSFVAERLLKMEVPVLLVVNKVDQLAGHQEIIPLIGKLNEKWPQFEIIPISARRRQNLDRLEQVIESHLPENTFFFSEEQLTDRSDHFLATEFIREKLIRNLGQELPYATTVAIESWERKRHHLHIHAVILVEKDSQKAIVIGHRGERLKRIGQEGRIALEQHFSEKVFLGLWVKVKENWSEDERILNQILV